MKKRALILVLGATTLAIVLQATAGAQIQGVTLGARPAAAPAFGAITLFGAVSNGREHESVTIEVKDCRQPTFRGVLAVETHAGGTWTTEFYPGITASIRAVWENATSAPVTVRQVPRVFVRRVSGGRFEISVSAKVGFWHRRALFQQRVSGSWKNVKQVLLTEQDGVGNQGIIWTSARFRAAVPRGRQVRAFIPAASAKPCYLPGASQPMKT